MKKVITAAILAVGMTFASGAAVAQDATGNVKTRFYNFDEMLIDGEIKKPSGLLTDVRQTARFRHLLDLKKSFLPTLENTAKEKALK